MTDTSIKSSATVFPQDDGTGVEDGAEKYNSAAYLAYLAKYKGTGSYVGEDVAGNAGLQFTVDTAGDTLDIGTGHAFVLEAGHLLQSGYQTTYDRTAPDSVPYVVIVDTAVTGLSLDAATDNDIWLAVDPTITDRAYIRHGSGLSPPSDPSVKLGTAHSDTGATTRTSDLAQTDFKDLKFSNQLEDGLGNTVTDLSNLGSGGGGFSQTTVTSNHSASNNQSVWVDASGGAVTVTLPSPTAGSTVRVVAVDATNDVEVSPNGSEDINGVSGNRTLAEGVSETYESDGSNWWVV